MKKFLIVIILIFCVLPAVIGTGNDKEIPNELYIKMNEINDSKILIGLSEKEVIEQLGEPKDIMVDESHLKNYTYYTFFAGHTFKKSFFGNIYDKKYYDLEVLFDPDGIVKYTYIHQIV